MTNPFIEVINQVMPEPQASLMNGIIFGVKTHFPKELYQALITTGTIHIIALSGQNISILTSIFSKITLPLGRKFSCLLTILAVIGFVMFVGLEATIIRAAIMGSLSLIAIYFGRKNWSLLSLIFAAIVMILVNPAWIGEISFQLSFFATLGIIIFGNSSVSNSKTTFEEVKRELKVNLRTTLAAQVFTLPLVFWYFGRISLISPLTNVLIGSFIAPIMVLGILISIFGIIFLPLGYLVGLIAWVPLTFILWVITATSKIPLASIEIVK